MNAERLQQIEELYHAALELEEGQRADFLREVCSVDEALRHEVETLLACGKRAEDVFELSAMELAVRDLARDKAQPQPSFPANIGHYRILRLLGEGGMGAVYEAEQEHPRRTVALKVIMPGLANPALLRRFEQESQALARLQHPGIAQIFEAGTADSGFGRQPYFAMEYIRGESLLKYAEADQLNTRQRLDLMGKVCEGVHHAHQRGIIHRDLKPGNILVDESGQPKILDLGVARVTDSDAQATRQTDVGQLVGTLAYMSPEQVLADPLEVDTRSDVYALGVVLFELLAGRLPYNISHQLHEAVQTIREKEPTPLSSVSRTYRGDIETIVAKALEKDKTRRYASAAGMAGDIRRYLNDEPIVARPPSATYQLQKFARKHKALVAGVAAVLVVLIAGIVVSAWEATRARRAEQMARTESATSRAVNDFLQNDLLAQASANVQARSDAKLDPNLKVRTALDRAAARIEDKFKGQPLVEASIRQTIGKTYEDLGLYADAQRHLERGLDLRRRFLGEEHPDTLSTMHGLAHLYWNQGRLTQAEPLFTKLLEVRRRVLGEKHPDTLDALNDLGTLYVAKGQYARAAPLYIQVLGLVRHTLGEEHPDTLASMNNLGTLFVKQGKYTEAETLFIKVLEVRHRVLGTDHPNTLASMNNLAVVYQNLGKYEQAESLLTKVLEIKRRVLGADHPNTLASMNNLGRLYGYLGKYEQAEQLLTKVLEVKRRVLGAEHPDTLISMSSLAGLYRDQGNYAQAEPFYVNALELQRRGLGAEHPNTLMSMNDLAFLYLKQRRYTRAVRLLHEAQEGYQRSMTSTWDRYSCQSLLGASLAGQNKYAEAEPLAVSGYEGMLQREATIPAASRFKLEQAGTWIVQLYQHWGKPEEAAEWQKRLQGFSR